MYTHLKSARLALIFLAVLVLVALLVPLRLRTSALASGSQCNRSVASSQRSVSARSPRLAEDDHSVEAPRFDGEHEPFGVGIQVRAPR